MVKKIGAPGTSKKNSVYLLELASRLLILFRISPDLILSHIIRSILEIFFFHFCAPLLSIIDEVITTRKFIK